MRKDRQLRVITCETKGTRHLGWMKNDPLLVWNATGIPLRSQGLSMINVCEGLDWWENQNQLFTKPLAYHKYVKDLLKNEHKNKRNQLYVILMDSDTLWSVNDIDEIWRRFDCARGNKEVIVSTEMGCWMGFHCTKNDTDHWYSNVLNTPSSSPFLNSGVIMGKASILEEMLQYIIDNKNSYLTKDVFRHPPVMRFHDQHAVADYALRIKPELFAPDYYQHFAGGLGIELPNGPSDSHVACKTLAGTIDYHCREVSVEFWKQYPNLYQLNETTCELTRPLHHDDNHDGHAHLKSLYPHPAVWHGNGQSKDVYLSVGGEAYMCYLQKAYPGLKITVQPEIKHKTHVSGSSR
jgi:hypothetical protein